MVTVQRGATMMLFALKLDYHLEDFSGVFIFHVNIRSLNKNINGLNLLINSLKMKPGIIICTKTFGLNCMSLYEISGYDMFFARSQ